MKAQRDYCRQLEDSGFDFGLVVGQAFIRGIRDIGYRSTGAALDELADNGIQAGAENVHVLMGFEGSSEKKPTALAVLDDGHGMVPTMIRAAVLWGGTHRENDRSMFGRYGYGLPSSAVSQGKRFTVYSITVDGDWHKCVIDIDAISKGAYTRKSDSRIVVPPAEPAKLPDWVQEYLDAQIEAGHFQGNGTHGTVVVIDKLDNVDYKTKDRLERHLKETFGIVYRNYLRPTNIFVNGDLVEPVDPLFSTPGFRYYDSYELKGGEVIIDEDRAESLPGTTVDVKDEDGKVRGQIRIRYSYMPPTFARIPRDKPKERGVTNPRFPILKDHNGFVVCRFGRQIDVVTRVPGPDSFTFRNNDRYWKVEIDFDPALDELFSVTTSKQQIVFKERIWQLLKDAGVLTVIKTLRDRNHKDRAALKAKRENPETERPSETVMKETLPFKTRKPAPPSPEEQARRKELWQKKVKERAKQTGKTEEEAEKELLVEVQGRPYKVEEESLVGAPFYRMEQVGGQKVLYLNKDHRFYTDLYAGPESTPRLRAALELLLMVQGARQLETPVEARRFHAFERVVWSEGLTTALEKLDEIDTIFGEDDEGPDVL